MIACDKLLLPGVQGLVLTWVTTILLSDMQSTWSAARRTLTCSVVLHVKLQIRGSYCTVSTHANASAIECTNSEPDIRMNELVG